MLSSAATDVRLHVAGGPVAQTIRAYAADFEADLIVMGRSKRFMHLGSTAVRVLRTTDRALLIVPPGAYVQTIGAEPSVHTGATIGLASYPDSRSDRRHGHHVSHSVHFLPDRAVGHPFF